MVGKEHKILMRDIRTYISYLTENSTGTILNPLNFFIESDYKDSKGEIRPCYLITRKGCDMVANKMTGENGINIVYNQTMKSWYEKLSYQVKIEKCGFCPKTISSHTIRDVPLSINHNFTKAHSLLF